MHTHTLHETSTRTLHALTRTPLTPLVASIAPPQTHTHIVPSHPRSCSDSRRVPQRRRRARVQRTHTRRPWSKGRARNRARGSPPPPPYASASPLTSPSSTTYGYQDGYGSFVVLIGIHVFIIAPIARTHTLHCTARANRRVHAYTGMTLLYCIGITHTEREREREREQCCGTIRYAFTHSSTTRVFTGIHTHVYPPPCSLPPAPIHSEYVGNPRAKE